MQSGFSLLESLICILLITFAFLATARVHLASLRDTQTSGQVGQAAQLANDLAERMRVNFRNTSAYTASAAPSAAIAACNTTTGCSATDMASNDLSEWNAALVARLPGGRGIVCRDSSPNDGASPASASCTGGATDPIAVKIWWNLRDDSGGVAALQRQTLAFVPRP